MQQKLNIRKLYKMYEQYLKFEKYEFENYVENEISYFLNVKIKGKIDADVEDNCENQTTNKGQGR